MLNRKELISCAYLMPLDSILQKSEQTFMRHLLLLGVSNPSSGQLYNCHKFAWRYISSLLMTSTRIGWIRHSNPQLFESALQSGKFSIRYETGIVWTLNPDYFLIRWLQPSSLQWIFKTVPSAMLSLLYFLDFSFKSYKVRAVKRTFLSFFPCRTDELGAVNKSNGRNSAWWESFVSETVTEGWR